MVNKTDSIPENMTIDEASEFWDIHSVTDYPSHIVKLKYSPKEKITFVAIADDLLTRVKGHAKRRGISIETLINLWIQEKASRVASA